MILAIQGTNNFSDYQVFLRAMGVGLSMLKDNDPYFYIYSAGPAKVNSLAMEFVNTSEHGLKLRGKKIKLFKVPPSWVSENSDSVDYFAFFSLPKESMSQLTKDMEDKGVEIGIFRY